ncbi:SGNH hydrolase domain-containing protein [Mycobacterium sp. smrl_JER01]|uniref:SGNH hydrolase domain-containing protein n=1 Tax=Mycobacterium sp. smrl_JER01 TaxID=3402633 RepID=UPI003ACDF72F
MTPTWSPSTTHNSPYDECVVWNQRVTEYLTGQARPAGLVLSYGSYPVRTRDVVPAAVNQLKPIAAQGTPIVVLRDTPVQNTSLPECVAGHRDDLLACATPRDQALGERDRSQPEVVASVPGASLIDLTDWICPSERCAAVGPCPRVVDTGFVVTRLVAA